MGGYVHEYTSVFLEHEDWSEWFTLDFYRGSGRKDPPRLIIGIAEEPLLRLIEVLPKYRILDTHKEQLQECGIKEDLFVNNKFLLDINKPWGFGGVLEPFVRKYGAVTYRHLAEYSIAIPRIEHDVGECRDCNGSREVNDGRCFHCMGTGRETTMRWDEINRIVATLSVLGIILDKPDKQWLASVNTKRKQLLSVVTPFGSDRAFISAVLARPFGDYLRRLSGQELPEVKAAIKSSYLQMFPRHARFGDFHFRAGVHHKGQLIIDVPGDACGLYVDGMSESLHEDSGPMKLSCHNVDSPAQQLTLLCGLAALADKARKSLYPMK